MSRDIGLTLSSEEGALVGRIAAELSDARLLPAFGKAMVAYHSGTAEHCERVGAMAGDIGVEFALNDEELEVLHWAGLLHDLSESSPSRKRFSTSRDRSRPTNGPS